MYLDTDENIKGLTVDDVGDKADKNDDTDAEEDDNDVVMVDEEE